MKTSIPIVNAKIIAQRIIDKMTPFCEKIEVAGSVRREKETVGDIEIVAIPKILNIEDLFGNNSGTQIYFPGFNFSEIGTIIKGGNKYKQIDAGVAVVDLFIVIPPAEWGVIFTIRTGNGAFSKLSVTQKSYGGFLPSNCKIKDGRVYRSGKYYPTPEECDFLRLIGHEGITPQERSCF
jgi:DNA polymerase/3'-5' exonuclease PolX